LFAALFKGYTGLELDCEFSAPVTTGKIREEVKNKKFNANFLDS